ncbi:MAG: hypothetical protein ACK4S4_03685 [Pyrinomonadaceae bacterium]
MITGFNTDVEFDGVTYHVQTEDKGLRTPFILSLVYHRGTILASRRVPYDDLIADGFDEEELQRRLQKLHKTICAAVSKGRLDDLKRMSARESGKPTSEPAAAARAAVATEARPERKARVTAAPGELLEIPIPMPPDPDSIPRVPNGHGGGSSSFLSLEIIDGPPIVAESVVEIVSELAGKDRPVSDKLSVELVGDSKFRAGERKTLTILVCRGSGHKVVPDAEVMVKVIGSSFRPLINHSRTDRSGISTVELTMPEFNEGRAAVIIRVISKGEEVELRKPLLERNG